MEPIVVFDDKCFLCSKFAKIVDFLSRGTISLIGHYSNKGEEIRTQFLDESALEMFWLIEDKIAYGGRAALFPLIIRIIFPKKRNNLNRIESLECNKNCKNVKSVFVRSASLLSKSKKINLK